jgi:hypothetical protein
VRDAADGLVAARFLLERVVHRTVEASMAGYDDARTISGNPTGSPVGHPRRITHADASCPAS